MGHNPLPIWKHTKRTYWNKIKFHTKCLIKTIDTECHCLKESYVYVKNFHDFYLILCLMNSLTSRAKYIYLSSVFAHLFIVINANDTFTFNTNEKKIIIQLFRWSLLHVHTTSNFLLKWTPQRISQCKYAKYLVQFNLILFWRTMHISEIWVKQ